MLIKFDFSSKTGILVVKFAFATANFKIETLRMRRRFARVLVLQGFLTAQPKACAVLVLHVFFNRAAESVRGSSLHVVFLFFLTLLTILDILVVGQKRMRSRHIIPQEDLFIYTTLLSGGGVLPYMGYIGMCGLNGYGFCAVLVINRVSILADFGHIGHK